MEEYVKLEGIKDVMMLIEESQALDDYDLIAVACQILSSIFAYDFGINAIKKRSKKYFEKFFELSVLSEQIKK